MKNNFWRIDGLQGIIEEKMEKYAARDDEEAKITVLIVEPDKKPYIKTIGVDEGAIYCALKGPTEGRTLYGTGAEIVFNRFGKTLGVACVPCVAQLERRSR